MKKKNLPALGFALALLLVLVVAAAIDYRALNSNQFTTSGTVSVKSGATVTNMQTYAPDAFYEIWLKSPLAEVDFGLIFTNSASKTIAILDGEDRTPLGSIDLNGFHGGGSGLTALNASSLSSGTVPNARLAGANPIFSGLTITGATPGLIIVTNSASASYVQIGTNGLIFGTNGALAGMSYTLTNGGATFSSNVVVATEAYDATGWNNNLTVPTKKDVRDKIEAIVAGATFTVKTNGVTLNAAATSLNIQQGANITVTGTVGGAAPTITIAGSGGSFDPTVSNTFNGTFIGNSVSLSNAPYAALFGHWGGSLTVNANITNWNSGEFFGGMSGSATNGTITNAVAGLYAVISEIGSATAFNGTLVGYFATNGVNTHIKGGNYISAPDGACHFSGTIRLPANVNCTIRCMSSSVVSTNSTYFSMRLINP